MPWAYGHMPGILGSNQRVDFERRLRPHRRPRPVDRPDRRLDAAAIQGDPELVQFAIAGGEKGFKTNSPLPWPGRRRPGLLPDAGRRRLDLGRYPRPDRVHHPSRHPERRRPGCPRQRDAGVRRRRAPRQGADRGCDPVCPVPDAAPDDEEAAVRGAPIFAENCASCHGETGEGVVDLGGPALNDMIWLYGGEPEQITAQIHRPRLGAMPPWQGRLDDHHQDAGGLRPQPGRRRVAGRPTVPRLASPHPLRIVSIAARGLVPAAMPGSAEMKVREILEHKGGGRHHPPGRDHLDRRASAGAGADRRARGQRGRRRRSPASCPSAT